MPQARIFASSVWGFDPDRWGAWPFADRKTRDKLAGIIGPDDFVLSIGTTGKEAQEGVRGRLLALMKISSELVETRQLVEPSFYNESVDLNGGEKWPFAFPIKSADAFDPRPLRNEVLPRIQEQNLFMALARHFVELTESEVQRVLNLPRIPVPFVYSTPTSAFAARLRKAVPGPMPKAQSRILTAESGPASTYLMELKGSALEQVLKHVRTDHTKRLYKVGFSNNPIRRLGELNGYYPCDRSLHWQEMLTQWHDDEINAWAMEQEVMRMLAEAGAERIKGEMFLTPAALIRKIWEEAKMSTQRPRHSISIRVLHT